MRIFIAFCLGFFLSSPLFGQIQIAGSITDRSTGEPLIGAQIRFNEQGTIADIDGNYLISLDPGTYTIEVAYVGYERIQIEQNLEQSVSNLDFRMEAMFLDEITVIADVAKNRETPVAFSSVSLEKIEEELGAQDLPMVLNSTPGIYATQQGGGDGDARISIRGFSQRNVAVLIDGLPVNDMENGWVYWSNWAGLSDVTKSMQVQRGLGASKLAIPSIGGTINIITKGVEARKGLTFRQEIGSFGYFKSTLGLTSGRLKNGWGFTFSGSAKIGNGYVQNAFTRGASYFIRIDKEWGNHLTSLAANGAPQSHSQRPFTNEIAFYDREYARELGIKDSLVDLQIGFGRDFSEFWGYLDRYDIREDGDTVYDGRNVFNTRVNFYHKPQITLKDFWTLNEKTRWSNIVYLSLGKGGGTRLSSSVSDLNNANIESIKDRDTLNGSILMQRFYDFNYMADPIQEIHETDRPADRFVYSQNNEHVWYGLLSTIESELMHNLNFSGGIDLRSYRGAHFSTPRDFLGADYTTYDPSIFKYSNGQALAFDRNDENFNRLPFARINKGDKIRYHNDAFVRWAGAFTQLEYKQGNLSTFLNLTASYSGHKRIDYFLKKDVSHDGRTERQLLGARDTLYANGDDWYVLQTDDLFFKRVYDVQNDTLYKLSDFDQSLLTGEQINNNSSEASFSESDWIWIPGFTLKGGLNYNLTERFNVYGNTGFYSLAPRFRNIFDFDNKKFLEVENQIIKAVELGVGYRSPKFTANFNAYRTAWDNRPVDGAPKIFDPDSEEILSYNINGMKALHQGVELDFIYKPFKKVEWEGLFSLGDWIWNSGDSVIIYNEAGRPVGGAEFSAVGVKVGDAAQTQFGSSIKFKPIKGLYFKARYTYFADYFADFDPLGLSGENADRQSWEMPAYGILDCFAGYRFQWQKAKIQLSFGMLNALDEVYLSDASNGPDYSANTATVYFGLGRRFSSSIKFML